MEAIVDSFPSIREERPVDTPVGRERAAFFGVRRDDRRDMLQCWFNAIITSSSWCGAMAGAGAFFAWRIRQAEYLVLVPPYSGLRDEFLPPTHLVSSSSWRVDTIPEVE